MLWPGSVANTDVIREQSTERQSALSAQTCSHTDGTLPVQAGGEQKLSTELEASHTHPRNFALFSFAFQQFLLNCRYMKQKNTSYCFYCYNFRVIKNQRITEQPGLQRPTVHISFQPLLCVGSTRHSKGPIDPIGTHRSPTGTHRDQ